MSNHTVDFYRLTHPKTWAKWQRGLGQVALLVATFSVGLYLGERALVPWPQSVAATVAVASLCYSAYTNAASRKQEVRKQTLAAFSEWSRSSHSLRVRTTQHLGRDEPISEEFAQKLHNEEPFRSLVRDFTAEETAAFRADIITTLNGLEHLATGVIVGVYDEDVLKRIGGSVIARTYLRFEPYIALVRSGQESSDASLLRMPLRPKPQAKSQAYVNQEALVNFLQEPTITARITADRAKISENYRRRAG